MDSIFTDEAMERMAEERAQAMIERIGERARHLLMIMLGKADAEDGDSGNLDGDMERMAMASAQAMFARVTSRANCLYLEMLPHKKRQAQADADEGEKKKRKKTTIRELTAEVSAACTAFGNYIINRRRLASTADVRRWIADNYPDKAGDVDFFKSVRGSQYPVKKLYNASTKDVSKHIKGVREA